MSDTANWKQKQFLFSVLQLLVRICMQRVACEWLLPFFLGGGGGGYFQLS